MAQTNISSIPFPLTMVEADPQKQARCELGEAFKIAQEQSIVNGTDKMTIEEINEEIANYRREKRENTQYKALPIRRKYNDPS